LDSLNSSSSQSSSNGNFGSNDEGNSNFANDDQDDFSRNRGRKQDVKPMQKHVEETQIVQGGTASFAVLLSNTNFTDGDYYIIITKPSYNRICGDPYQFPGYIDQCNSQLGIPQRHKTVYPCNCGEFPDMDKATKAMESAWSSHCGEGASPNDTKKIILFDYDKKVVVRTHTIPVAQRYRRAGAIGAR